MSAYVISELEVRDGVAIETYRTLAAKSIAQYGGRHTALQGVPGGCWGRGLRARLPTLVLARSIILASCRGEWPSPGGRPGWAADRSDRCPPKPRGLSSVARSRSALHRDPDG